MYGCTSVTDEGITALATHCPTLSYLILSGCRAVTNAALEAIAHNKCAAAMKFISVSYCREVTDAGCEALRGSCVMLKTLDLSSCTGVTGGMVASLRGREPAITVMV
jgi:hypothetical protein